MSDVPTPGGLQNGVSDPTSWFTSLSAQGKQLVLSPHVYGPKTTGSTTNTAGTGLFERLSRSFGSKMDCGAGGLTLPW